MPARKGGKKPGVRNNAAQKLQGSVDAHNAHRATVWEDGVGGRCGKTVWEDGVGGRCGRTVWED
eukprot:28985-Chlamydomonas_euryale.AAC.2